MLFSGPAGAGKTPSVTRYKDYLISLGYAVSNFNRMGTDFNCLLIKDGRKIIFWSATDTPKLINELADLIKLHPDAEAVVCSCKSYDVWPRQYQFKKLKLTLSANTFFEIPLGRQVTGSGRHKSLGWYLDSVLKIAILVGSQPPFSF